MAYLDTKTIKGKKYMYLRQSVRQRGGRVKHKNVKYLGPVDPVYKARKKRKDNSWIFTRKLSEGEKAELVKQRNHGSGFARDRVKIILWSGEGLSCLSIAGKIGCDVRKVRAAIKDFNARGLECLIRGKAKGAEPKFTDDIRKRILREFAIDPLECGHVFTAWTLPRFRKHLMDCRVVESISIETLRQILDKAGARLKRSKRWQYSPDKDFVKKNVR